jgi:ABC-2 type transport system ATP-binding protein
MKQRLGIATALLGNPKLLILDEPTNGLDPAGIQEMRELIKSLPKKTGMTILISSHLLFEIDQMATQVGIISKGKMLFQDSIEKLRQHASHKVAIRVGAPDSAMKCLLKNGITTTQDQGWLYLDAPEDEHLSQLVKKLIAQNISIYRIEERIQSLEDIFLKFTNGEESL